MRYALPMILFLLYGLSTAVGAETEGVLSAQNSSRQPYLEARALFRQGQYQEAIDRCQQLIETEPDSEWMSKATFLQADAYARLREFSRAAEIYEQQAKRLLHTDRKRELSEIYLRFAELVSREPDKHAPDALPPDYEKAHRLYAQALQLEIPDEVRDDVMFRMARTRQLAKQWDQAIEEYNRYLQAFDPDPETLNVQRSTLKGKHVLEAHYHLAECQIEQRTYGPAAMRLENLIARIGEPKGETEAKLLRDARFLLVQAYRSRDIGASASLGDIGWTVGVAHEFIAAYPDDPRHIRLSYEVAAIFESVGAADKALKAYAAFAAGEGIHPAAEADAGDLSEEDRYDRLKMGATFRVGQILLQQGRYMEARDAWQRYITEFPNGPQWTEAQQRVIDTEFYRGLEQMRQEQYDEAKETWDTFLSQHPLDPRCRQILFTLALLHLRAPEPSPDDVRQAIQVWQQLVRKYPNTDESSLAQLRIGQAYEEKLGLMEEALDAYRKLTWGSHAEEARQRVVRMTQKQLKVVTERVYRTDEPAVVTVDTRNIEKLTVRMYTLDLEAYWRKRHGITEVENLDIGLIAPDKTWEFIPADYVKYKPMQSKIEIPMDGPGVAAVQIGDDDFEATTLVIRSDVDMILKTSRREVLLFVQNMQSNEPVPDARVLISDGEQIIAEGKTNADGVFQQSIEKLAQAGDVSAMVLHEGHVAVPEGLMIGDMRLSQGLQPRGYLYTDRPAYRPGQEVAIRGILREVKAGSYAIPDKPYTLNVLDAQGRSIHQEEVMLSEFSTFSTQLVLDSESPVGEYRMVVQRTDEQGPASSGSFQVQRFQLQKIGLSVEFSQNVYFRGESVEAIFTASYYYGQPVPDRTMRITLPDGRTVEEQSDADGKVTVSFDTSLFPVGRPLHFGATLLGEDVRVDGMVFLANLGYSIEVQAPRQVLLAGEPREVLIETRDPQGKPVGRDLKLKVLQVARDQGSPLLQQTPWFSDDPGMAMVEAQDIASIPDRMTTDAKTGRVRLPIQIDAGGEYLIRAEGVDRFGQQVIGEARLQVSDDSDRVRLRIFTERQLLRVGEEATARIHSRLAPSLGLVTFEGEGILEYRVLKLAQGYNDLTFAVDHAHFPNFYLSVAVIDPAGDPPENRPQLRTAGIDFTVERQLKIEIEPDQESYAPGEVANLKVRALDQLGKPVHAELSLALVDEALYARFPDRVPEIRVFFEEGIRRAAALRTVSSCTFLYTPPTRATVQAWVEEADREVYQRKMARQRVEGLTELESLKKHAADVLALGVELKERNASELAATSKPRAPVTRSLSISARQTATASFDAALSVDDKGYGGSGEPPVREELLEAGVWIPSVVTDAEGKAEITLTMPQKTTEWRLTARGCSVETLVGQVRKPLVTRQPFFLELKLPAILTEGDVLRPMLRLHNLTDFEGDAEVEIGWANGGRTGVLTHTVTLKPKTIVEAVLEELPPLQGDELRIDAGAKADEGRLSDALRASVPIRPWGIEVNRTKSGQATGNTSLFVELPTSLELYNRRLDIQIAPRAEDIVLRLALGTPAWREVAGRSMVPRSTLNVPTFQRVSTRIRIPGDLGSDLLAVAAALQYLQDVPGRTQDVDTLLRRARSLVGALVVRQQKGGWRWSPGTDEVDAELTARAVWALAAIREQGVDVPNPTLEEGIRVLKSQLAQSNDDEQRALLLVALTSSGNGDFSVANRLYRNRANLNQPALLLTALVFAMTDRAESAQELLDQALADTAPDALPADRLALALLTQLQTATREPANAQTRQHTNAQMVEALLGKYRWGGFQPYHAKGPAALALARYYAATQFAANDYRLKIQVNGNTLHESEIRGNQPFVTLTTDRLEEGSNKIEFEVDGQARYAYTVSLSGFLRDIPEKIDAESPLHGLVSIGNVERHYYHAQLEHNGQGIATSTSPITQLPYGERTRVSVQIKELPYDTPLLVVESLPAGTTLLKDSVAGNYRYYESGDGEIRFYLDPRWGRWAERNRNRKPSLRFEYELMGYALGKYRALPLVVSPLDSPSRRLIGSIGNLTVLAPGEASPDPYVMNDGERFELGKVYFDEGNDAEALPLLKTLREQQPNYQDREVARMLLWISTEEGFFDAPLIVDTFEVLRERSPELTIPFRRILVVAEAYRKLGEFERAYLVFRSTLSASYASDSEVSAVLQDEGQFLNSTALQARLWLDYPDTPEVTASYFGLSQALYAKAPEARQIARTKMLSILEPPVETPESLTSVTLLQDAVRLLADFITLYPTDPLADDATFSMANAYLDFEAYPQAVELCQAAQQKFRESEFLSSFQYVQALGLFSQHQFEEAIQAAKVVAEGRSKDQMLARYILGQIYHAQGSPDEAIQWYQQVQELYPDAAESIEAFQERRISLDEVTRFRPGEPVTLKLKYRNIKEAALQVYRVDLMKLYLREKNLSQITQVRLEGITPEQMQTVTLGDGKDYADKEVTITLNLANPQPTTPLTRVEGAYLVICRGDDLFTSGLVLITPLTMEIQEGKDTGRVRVNVQKQTGDGYPEGVHVKVVGSADQRIISGETDLRGIFIADGVRGYATVLAREGENRYAFHRGTEWIGAPERSKAEQPAAPPAERGQVDYRKNLSLQNQMIQGKNLERFEQMRRGRKRGVEVQAAY